MPLANNNNAILKRQVMAEQMCSACLGQTASLGLDTYKVPMALYELNRMRLVQAIMDDAGERRGVILLQGGAQTTRYDTDHEPVFRQESYFHWTFGVSEADVYGAISLPSGKATLFVSRPDLNYEIFCGTNTPLQEIQEYYNVEQVLPLEQLEEYISSQLVHENSILYLLKGQNTDSGSMMLPATYEGIGKHSTKMDLSTLFGCMAELRVYKTAAEIDLMRYTHWVSSMAHVEVMKACQPGMMEYQLESLFQHHTYTHGGCRHQSYTCICACGPSGSILHYGHAGRPNNRLLTEQDMALLDMGAEYMCYASDITCSFPVRGQFTDNQKLVYQAVLNAQVAVIQAIKPGVSWKEMHRKAERAILATLKDGEVVSGDVDEMLEADLGAIFMPHGLGHLIGLDTHDVGGYLEGTPGRSSRPGLSKLRTARILEENMVLTVEPGCYFIDPLMDLALANPKQSKFLNADRFNEFRNFGGVRLEDGVLVTKDGCENLTNCPRALSEVLDVMKGGSWPPSKDVMPELRRKWMARKSGKMQPLSIEPVTGKYY